jgi:hypothetical protein
VILTLSERKSREKLHVMGEMGLGRHKKGDVFGARARKIAKTGIWVR